MLVQSLSSRFFCSSTCYLLLSLCLLGCKDLSDASSSTHPTADSSITATKTTLNAQSRDALKQSYATTPFKVLSIAELSFDNAPAIAVTFSSPIDPTAKWRDDLTITLKDKSAPKGDWVLGDNLTTVYFPFIEPQTQYNIRVSKNIPGLTGRQLQAAFSKKIHTRNKERSVKFLSFGTQLSPSLSDGLTVEAVNVEAVDVDFFRVRPEQLSAFFAQNFGGQVYELQNIQQYANLVYSARFDLNFVKNKRQKSTLPITHQKELKKPGVYFTVLREAGKYDYDYQSTWFTMGDIGLQVRQIGDHYVAFTHHAVTAKPSHNVTITLFDNNAKALADNTSSKEGFTEFTGLTHTPSFAIAQKGEHYSVLKLRTPAMDLSEFPLPKRAQKPLELFLYAPRDLYRPGESVHINGLLRDNDARLAGAPPIKAKITTPDNRTYQSFNWQGDEQAFYTHNLTLPKDAVRGEWQLQATLGNGDVFRYPFHVEDFLPERMKLQLQGAKNPHVVKNPNHSDANKLSIDVQGDYLYGAPAAGNRIEINVETQQARTLFKQWKNFIFGAEDYRDYNTSTDLPTVQLNSKGHTRLTLPNEWQGATQPLKITTRVSLFESGGRPVSRAISHYLWPRENLIGIRPTWTGKFAGPNAQALLELIQINTQGEQTAAEHIDVLVLRENRQYYWEWNHGWQNSRNNNPIPVYNRVIQLAANERTPIAIPVEYGNYKVEIRNKAQELLTSYRFYAGWSWDKPETGETGRPDAVKLSWDANAYGASATNTNANANNTAPTATLSLEAPYPGTALITLEADELLWHKNIEVTAGTNSLSIPIDTSWNRHDIYATVNIIRQGDAKHKHLPKRAFGVLHLPLDRSAQHLQLSLEAPEKTEPEVELHAKIRVAPTHQGTVNLTLSAVDSGILSLSNFETPEPHTWFFAPRAYSTELRDTWASFIEQLSSVNARQRFGGDAESELARGGEAPQTDVQVVELYSGKVTVDKNGEANIPLKLPYFNGELRLMAVAWADNAFGHLEAKITIAAPLIAEVSTPRFLAYGDHSNATFDVQNLTDETQTLSIKATASKELYGKQALTNIALAPKQKHTLQLPIVAQQSNGQGQVNIDITSTAATSQKPSNAITLKRSWNVGLRPAYPAINQQTDAVIAAGKTFTAPTYEEPPYEIPQQQMRVSVSPQPPLNLNEHLSNLMQYPYGCLEQTTSRAWPLLISTQEELNRFASAQLNPNANTTNSTSKAVNTSLAHNRSKAIVAAIGRISGMERGDGSFGLWNNQSNEEHWLSAYATEFLLSAKEQGYAVDDALLKRALQRLKTYVKTQGKLWNEAEHYSRWPDHYHIAYRAYAALVLARKQQITLSELRNLYDGHASMSKTSLPLAQLAKALELAGDVRRAKEAWQQALANTPREQGYTGDYGTPVRDLAWVSTLALSSKLVEHPLERLMQLRDALTEKRWLSTQDRWALFRLGHSLQANALPQWQLQIHADAQQQNPTLTSAFHDFWQGEDVPNTLTVTNPNQQPLFVNLQYSGYPTKAPAPVSDGIRVQRIYYNHKGDPININSVTSGDLILVRLDISSTKNRIPDALVVDLLPAGFELENQNLEAAVKMHHIKVQNKTVSQWLNNARVVHEEYRDDRYVAAIQLRRKTSTLFYLARAVTPGTYTIPPTLVEDMYRPWLRAVGATEGEVIVAPK